MVQIIGVALWALIPGFVAKKKGRNFWGYYFLSFVLSPLIVMIITFCLSDISGSENQETEAKSKDDDNKINFCRKCGELLIDNSKFCRKCGTEIVCTVDTYTEFADNSHVQKYQVCIFDMGTQKLRREIRDIDTLKFPASKFAFNDTYYAIETLKNGKKVRVYCTKESWEKQIENKINEEAPEK